MLAFDFSPLNALLMKMLKLIFGLWIFLLFHTATAAPLNSLKKEEKLPGDATLFCSLRSVYVPLYDLDLKKVRSFRVYVFIPKHSSATNKVPLVVSIATIVGLTPMEFKIGTHFCKNGMAAAIADFYPEKFPVVTEIQKGIDSSSKINLEGVQKMLDMLVTWPEIDSSKIGMLAVSIGTMPGAIASLVDDRIVASVLVAPIGHVADVVAESKARKLARWKAELYKKGIVRDQEELRQRLRDKIKYDPILFANPSKRDKFMHVIIERDEDVPTPYQLEYHKQMGDPKLRTLNAFGHGPQIVGYILFSQSEVISFFKEKFHLL